eukprot:CAMPEP_0174861228 /NCGR_PEP_ID=MMETSP1114-20130205/51099_1 /TAXON_ID=312471 /ORGANISM="Neobodo designis, Strain CCAP 1951/1" /LENGTH=41 /DNA_ID= /DNA_START= /DNA_END= /DNA_ORIENTATION=
MSRLTRKASVSLTATVPILIAKRLEKLGFQLSNQSGSDLID